MSLPLDVVHFLQTALDKSIDNFDIIIHSGNKKGDGFLGEVIFVTLKNKTTQDQKHWIVKHSLNLQGDAQSAVEISFKNEIYFYEKIWKNYLEFQKNTSTMVVFDKLPHCIATSSTKGMEKLLLENLKFSKFEVFDKKKPFDKEHMEMVFDTYGVLHGISFAYKELHYEQHCKMVDDIVDVMKHFIATGFMSGTGFFYKLYLEQRFDNIDNKLKEKLNMYVDNVVDMFSASMNCKRSSEIILHGDCWSNNMLFKYNEERQPIDIRLIDFQLIKCGSPVIDLSYCIYASGSKTIFDELEYYMNTYHCSLSRTLKKFDLDSEKLYPIDTLKNEWKDHCIYGMVMAMYLWSVKLVDETEIKNLQEYQEITESEDAKRDYFQQFFDIPAFSTFIDDMISHAHANGYI